MVHFCEAVIQEIQIASDQDDVEDIIRVSYIHFTESKSQDIGKYIINMIVMLRISAIASKNDRERNNVLKAIQIFRRHQQDGINSLF